MKTYGLNIGQWFIVGFGFFVAFIMLWQILKFFAFAIKFLIKRGNDKKSKEV
jgi:hypothetical protein